LTGTTYTIKVQAVNENGSSVDSASFAYIHAYKSDPPTSVVTAVESDGYDIRVTWVAPASNNGAEIESYIVYWKQTDGVFTKSDSTYYDATALAAEIHNSVLNVAPFSLITGDVV
jgi:predicted phage tail protein